MRPRCGVRGSAPDPAACSAGQPAVTVPACIAWAPHGVGGVFEGTTANLNLRPVPGSATHPAAGTTGDLFVDQTGRLWYRRATGSPAIWVQLA